MSRARSGWVNDGALDTRVDGGNPACVRLDHGVNDPVARKILATHAAEVGLAPPADTSIVRRLALPHPFTTTCSYLPRTGSRAPQTSLFLSSLPPTITEDLIRAFYLSTGSIPATALKSIVLVPTSRVAFVNFADRKTAELAAERSAVKVVIDGAEIKVQWGRSRPRKDKAGLPPATGEMSVIAERELASSGK